MADLHQRVTDAIVASIERGGLDKWRRPWSVKAGSGSSPLPYNVASGATYRGINTVMLWSARETKGYETHLWGTFQQWKDRGAMVRKGEKATLGVFFKKTQYEVEGEDKVRNSVYTSGFSLFNRDQVDGYEPPAMVVAPEVDRIAVAEDFLRNTGANIEHGDARAYYMPSMDLIRMPHMSAFKSTVLYYSTALHETVHWTGTKARCDRRLDARFGTQAYAMEELVAEIGAAFLCAGLGLDDEPREDHAQYVASWLRVLKSDSTAIFKAASLAQRASDYLTRLQAAAEEDERLAA